DFRVKMWGTSSPDNKLADDLGNAIEGTRISGRRSDFFRTEKLAPDNLGLLQQYLPIAAVSRCNKNYSMISSARPSSAGGNARPSAFAVLRLMTSSTFVDC